MSHLSVLPKLPVPTLSGSLDRFLSVLAPLLTPEQFSQTLRLTDKFKTGQGPILQEKVLKLSRETDNWATHVWLQTRFLRNRDPLPLTNGSSAIDAKATWSTRATKQDTIAKYIVYLAEVAQRIRTNKFNWDQFGTPNMEPYKRVFGGHRLPGLKIDSYKLSPHSNHIVVMNAGNVYKVPVHTGERPVTPQEMYSLLRRVLETGQEGASLGLLTALDRDAWYIAREHLQVSPVNRASLATIEECIFAVCIDNWTGDVLKQTRFGDRNENFKYFNRWHGVGFQTVISADGHFAWSTEHSLIDGGSIGLFKDLPDLLLHPGPELTEVYTPLEADLLEWELTPLIRTQLEVARAILTTFYDTYDIHTFKFKDYGKIFIKSNGLYYHGYMQLALQMVYYELHKSLCSMYQPIEVRKYRAGRLEQIRTGTNESKAFVECVKGDCGTMRRKYELMVRAIQRHKDIVTEGNLYVKHLQGLEMISKEEGIRSEFFESKSYRIFSTPLLAGASVYSPVDGTGINLPISKDGYFMVTQPSDKNTHINVAICSATKVSSEKLCLLLEHSLMEMKEIVINNKRSKL